MKPDIERVLLLSSRGADERKVLAAIRGLSSAGVAVALASNEPRCISRHSRYCREFFVWRGDESDPSNLLAFLESFLASEAVDAVLPLCDYTTQALVQHQGALSRHTGLCLPAQEQMSLAADKERLLEVAEAIGVGIPKSVCVHDAEMLEQVAGGLGYPCVLKLRRGAGGVGLSIVSNLNELQRAYAGLQGSADPVFDRTRPLLQEFIPGEVHDVCVLFNRGEPRAAMTQRRLTMLPAAGGIGIHNETTDDPELRDQAICLMRALKWHGPAQVEFKRDTRDGSLRLMEVNTRFWGTLDLALQAGINFPLLAAKLAVLGDVPPVREYRAGIQYRWLFNYDGPERPAGRLQPAALRWSIIRTGNRFTDFWWSDPVPHFALARQYWADAS